MDNFRNFLNQFVDVTDEEFLFLISNFKEESIKANTQIITNGQIASKIYFIKSGLLRTYFLSEGKEVSTYFACDGQLITSYASFIPQTGSAECLETLDDSVLYSISFEALNSFYKSSLKFERLARILAEQNYLCVLERMIYLQSKSAKEKYLYFIHKYDKKIIQRAPLSHIASYLGITPETLSRVRKNLSTS